MPKPARRHLVAALSVAALSLASTGLAAHPPAEPPARIAGLPESPAGDDLNHVLHALGDAQTTLDTSRFSEAFLAQVPAKRLVGLTSAIRMQAGSMQFVRLEPTEAEHALTAVCRGSKLDSHFRIDLTVDEAGQIDGLLLRPAPDLDVDEDTDWADVESDLDGLAGSVSFSAGEVGEDGSIRTLSTINDQTPLAIGSAFKLYILQALGEQIIAGERAWDDQLAIDPALKSLPSGTMQNDADGTEHPLSHYALMMISISDNTATDHLLDLVGRAPVEACMRRLNPDAARSMPFLSTHEMFKIKLGGDRMLIGTYAGANEADRREMLQPGGPVDSAEPSMLLAMSWKDPVEIERIEWFASAASCARVMVALRDLAAKDGNEPLSAALSANPGIPLGERWAQVFFKGGSEPGVLNLTWLLERDDGRTFTLSVGVNDPDKGIAQEAVIAIAGKAATLLERAP